MATWIKIKYAGSKCKSCGKEFQLGEKAKWYKPGVAYHKTNWEEVDGKWIPLGCITEAQLKPSTGV